MIRRYMRGDKCIIFLNVLIIKKTLLTVPNDKWRNLCLSGCILFFLDNRSSSQNLAGCIVDVQRGLCVTLLDVI